MKEKLLSFKRPEPTVVGSVSKEKKEKIKQKILENFGEGHYNQIPEDKRKILESLEYEKKPYEKSAIDISNKITNLMISEFGLTPFDIPEKNIHIVPESLYKEIDEGKNLGATFQKEQIIVLNAEKNMNFFGRVSTIFHEIIHLKGYFSLEAQEDSLKLRRSGLKMNTSFKKEKNIGNFNLFHGLNEAVVAEIEKEYFKELVGQNQFLKKEYEWESSEEAQKLKEKIAEENGINADEILSVNKNGKNFETFSYIIQRKVLNYIVDQIYKDNEDKFNSRDDVMKLFFKAHFDGKIINLAKLIEKSFGKKAFRVIGIMDEQSNSARSVMDYLMKSRVKR